MNGGRAVVMNTMEKGEDEIVSWSWYRTLGAFHEFSVRKEKLSKINYFSTSFHKFIKQ